MKSRVLAVLLTVGSFCPARAAGKISRQPAEPVFSRDGKQIVYIDKVEREGETTASLCGVWTINADGSGARRLTTGACDSAPQWSPDGKRIAFERGDDVWLVNADGSGLVNVTASQRKIDSEPQWTNDGKQLLYLSDELVELGGQWHESGRKLISRDMAAGKERMVLDNDWYIEDIVPTPERNDLVYLRCTKVGADGKPEDNDEYDPAIVALNLQTAQMRNVFSLDKKVHGDRTIEAFARGPEFMLVEAESPEVGDNSVAILREGKLEFLPELLDLGGLSPDGKQIVDAGIFKSKYQWGLQLYDITAKNFVAELETGITDLQLLKARDYYIKGKALANAYKYLEAIPEFSEAVKLDPQYVDAWYQRGLSYGEAGDTTKAIADFGTVLGLNKTHADAVLHRAALYQNLGNDDKAMDDYIAASVFYSDPQKKAFAFRKRAEIARKKGWERMAKENEDQAKEYEAKARQ